MSARDLRGLLPREHGSWAYLLAPQLAALIAAPRFGPAAAWAVGSVLLFCGFQGFAAARRRKERFSAAGIAAAAVGLVAIAVAARARPAVLLALVPSLAPIGLGLVSHGGRIGRDDLIEVFGVAAAAILGSGGLLAGGGNPRAAGLLAAASFCYFALSLIWVRIRLTRALPGRRTLLPGGWNIPASLALLAGSAAFGIAFARPLAGFLPGIYVVRALLPPPRGSEGRLSVPRLGIQEGLFAAIFAVGLGLFL